MNIKNKFHSILMLILLLFLVLIGCETTDRMQVETSKEEIESREVEKEAEKKEVDSTDIMLV